MAMVSKSWQTASTSTTARSFFVLSSDLARTQVYTVCKFSTELFKMRGFLCLLISSNVDDFIYHIEIKMKNHSIE